MSQDQRGKTAGVLVSSQDAWFVRRTLGGIRPELESMGWNYKAFELEGLKDLDYHRFIEEVAADPEISGIIYGHLRLSMAQLARFRQNGLAVVGVTERAEGVDWITVDELHGAYLATEHLLSLGHRRLALLNGPPLAVQACLREDGFRRALADADLKAGRDLELQILNFTEGEGRDAANMLLDLPHPPTAIFVAAGDVTALGVMEALRERGVRVPQDISVVGFDDLEVAGLCTPPLSTVHQPLEAMGRWAARQLIKAVTEGPAHKPVGEIYAPQLIVRGTSAKAANLSAAT